MRENIFEMLNRFFKLKENQTSVRTEVLAGKGREIGWLNYLLGAILLAYFILIRGKRN